MTNPSKKVRVFSPEPKIVKEELDNSYQIVLTFNADAELIDVAHPSNFDLELVNDHIKVVFLFLTQQLAGAKTAQG